ncbi:GNAT family N-acetyltransferase [Entomomonas sp. E2T0]|uniref:GNAT family N-acetyltransferase n=1 Tax=Entomomonas sp. E2T0 TaxID=2930213 RepID=UPI0022284AE7|nr:GNAT family N-acetyltransferase [Entomomonas sp. E2T0]UYZ84665.1 GNAT family N-acetyltransferase [Entomomonas sp. E2T0]
MTNVIIRFVEEKDYQQWIDVYKGYISFYQRDFDEKKVATVWQWIKDKKMFALVAELEGELVGLAHYREMLSPLNGFTVGFLDDLFVNPDCRGKKVVDALMQALKQQAQQQGWPFIRWITAENNYRAKAFYDRIATKTAWNTYQMDC